MKKKSLSAKKITPKNLNFNKIHLIGFSLGALIARHFASEHSDKLSSLIIHGSIYKRTEAQKRVVLNRYEVAKLNKPASKQTALRRWLSEEFIKKNPDIYKKIYSILEKNNRSNFLKCLCLSSEMLEFTNPEPVYS